MKLKGKFDKIIVIIIIINIVIISIIIAFTNTLSLAGSTEAYFHIELLPKADTVQLFLSVGR